MGWRLHLLHRLCRYNDRLRPPFSNEMDSIKRQSSVTEMNEIISLQLDPIMPLATFPLPIPLVEVLKKFYGNHQTDHNNVFSLSLSLPVCLFRLTYFSQWKTRRQTNGNFLKVARAHDERSKLKTRLSRWRFWVPRPFFLTLSALYLSANGCLQRLDTLQSWPSAAAKLTRLSLSLSFSFRVLTSFWGFQTGGRTSVKTFKQLLFWTVSLSFTSSTGCYIVSLFFRKQCLKFFVVKDEKKNETLNCYCFAEQKCGFILDFCAGGVRKLRYRLDPNRKRRRNGRNRSTLSWHLNVSCFPIVVYNSILYG